MRKITSRLVLPGVALALLLGNCLQVQVLQQVPSNAVVVVKANNLQQVNGKIAALTQQWGLAAMQPAMGDPLASLKGEMQIEAGLNEAGEAAFVLVPMEGRSGPQWIVLLPVSDYQAFLGNFPDVTTEGDIATFTVDEEDRTYFVSQWGQYAAVAEEQVVLANKPEGLQVQGLAAREMQGKDLVAYVNMPALREKALPELARAREKMNARFDRQMAQTQPTPEQQRMLPAGRAMANQAMNMVERFLTDAQAATWGLSLSEEGIGSTLLAEFVPESTSGQMVSQFKNTDQPLVTGLPSTKYLMYGGMLVDTETWNKLLDDFLAPMLQEMSAEDEQTQALNEYFGAIKANLAASQQSAFGWVAPTGLIGQQGLFQLVGVTTGDAQAIAEAQRKLFQSQQAFMNLFQPNAGQVTLTHTANAKTVNGVAMDRFQTQFNLQPQTPEEMQAAQMMMFMYGPNGMDMYGGVVDEQHYLAVIGGNDQLITDAVAAVKADANLLATTAPAQGVAQKLPQQRFAVLYVPLDQIVMTGVRTAQQFGAGIPLKLPPNLPPIGMTASSEASAVRLDAYVPSQLVQSLIAAGMQAFMQGQGGPPGGPEGL